MTQIRLPGPFKSESIVMSTVISDAKSSKKVSKANNRATNSGRYAYKAVLGEGSFGSVLKATDKSTDEDVAVKIIKAKKSVIEQILFFKTSASIKQGRKEVLILTDLQHENITAIRDHFKFRKSAFKSGLAIVMEYCPGGDHQKHLEGLAVRGERTIVRKDVFHGSSSLHPL